MPASAAATGLHWQVSQATSLMNVVVEMSADPASNHQGNALSACVSLGKWTLIYHSQVSSWRMAAVDSWAVDLSCKYAVQNSTHGVFRSCFQRWQVRHVGRQPTVHCPQRHRE